MSFLSPACFFNVWCFARVLVIACRTRLSLRVAACLDWPCPEQKVTKSICIDNNNYSVGSVMMNNCLVVGDVVCVCV